MTRCAGIGSSLLFRAAFKFGAAQAALDLCLVYCLVDNEEEKHVVTLSAGNEFDRLVLFLLADVELGPFDDVAHSNLMLPAAGTPLPHRQKPLPPAP